MSHVSTELTTPWPVLKINPSSVPTQSKTSFAERRLDRDLLQAGIIRGASHVRIDDRST